jgi:aspartate kinase
LSRDEEETKLLIVKKFGGSSVANAERIKHVAQTIVNSYKEGNQVVVVLSAQGDTTDELIEKAQEINPHASKREMDMLLATGEQQSVALMAMAIEALGYPVISLNAFQCKIVSTSTYSNARIKDISTERITNELEKKNIVIITGFQGINRHLDVTTLGRGGSDTSAVALAAKLHADICEIYTDVDGVYTADPRLVKDARKLDEITYDEMLELASLGAKVLHNRSVELAKKYNVNLVVRSSMTDAEGTVVKEETKVEKMLVNGVAVDKDVARISLVGLKDEPGTAFKIFSLLSKEKVSVDIIIQSIGRSSSKDISFTVAQGDLETALKVLEENQARLGFDHMSNNPGVAKVSIVGAGMATNPGVASMLFEATYDAGINVNMISTSEIKISLLVDEKDADRAAVAIHDKFMTQSLEVSR